MRDLQTEYGEIGKPRKSLKSQLRARVLHAATISLLLSGSANVAAEAKWYTPKDVEECRVAYSMGEDGDCTQHKKSAKATKTSVQAKPAPAAPATVAAPATAPKKNAPYTPKEDEECGAGFRMGEDGDCYVDRKRKSSTANNTVANNESAAPTKQISPTEVDSPVAARDPSPPQERGPSVRDVAKGINSLKSLFSR
ncbi:MAG: hypothetical protein V4508_17395 [Pseudomonadota bacterium]